VRAVLCCTEAADKGQLNAQFECGAKAWAAGDWQRYRWWGLAAARRHNGAITRLLLAAVEQLRLWQEGSRSGRIVFELGVAFKGRIDAATKTTFGSKCSDEKLQAAQRCVELHEEWIALTKGAIECWLAIARRLKVVKDIRLVVAKLLWAERADWSRVYLCKQERAKN
jgi:hypothetical protein